MRLDVILRVITKLLLPFILLFGLYVQFHGETGPGGGFQAGVIVGACIILYAIMFGLDRAMRVLPVTAVEKMISSILYSRSRSIALALKTVSGKIDMSESSAATSTMRYGEFAWTSCRPRPTVRTKPSTAKIAAPAANENWRVW